MWLIHQVRPLLELGICKEYCMAHKTNGNAAPNRKKKALASINPAIVPALQEVRKTVQETRLEDEIRLRAYEIYLQRNGSPGDENQDWLIAEREIRARH
jgi:hypothetical protein